MPGRTGDTLTRILVSFARIPYENISKLIKLSETGGEWDRFRLPAEVWEDFRRNNLGGTCFSLTFFLWAILDFLRIFSLPSGYGHDLVTGRPLRPSG